MLDELAIHDAQIAGRDQVHAGLGAPAQHQPAIADIAALAVEAAGDVDAGGDVRRAVLAVLEMNGKPGEVGIGAGQHHLMHRRLTARYFHRRDGRFDPRQDFLEQVVFRHVEGERQPPPRAHHIAGEFRLLRPGLADQHRLRVAVEMSGDVDEVARLAHHVELAGLFEPLDETA